MNTYIDLRSDTVTLQPPEMIRAMASAKVGDAVYEDDPTTKKLERMAAMMMGKEDAAFVCSGTMGNQVSIMSHTRRGDQILCGFHAHIAEHECGAPAVLSGVSMRMIDNTDHRLYPKDLDRYITPDDIHMPRTSLVCVENALADGTVIPLQHMEAVYHRAHDHHVPVHLDGARIFNAALALHCKTADVAQYADSVMFCLSKGLCAPIGSMVCGTREFIKTVKRNRKMLGGGLRQSGYLAACGIYALQHMVDRLAEDHENAHYLAEQLATLPHIAVKLETVQINLVYFTTDLNDTKRLAWERHMKEHGILIGGYENGMYRFATHYGINKSDIDTVVTCMRSFLSDPNTI